MATQNQPLKQIDTQPSIVSAGSGQRLSSSTLRVRSVILQAPLANTGVIYVASTENNVTSTNRVELSAGDSMTLDADRWGNLHGMIDLNDIWINGSVTSDKVTVLYLDATGIHE